MASKFETILLQENLNPIIKLEPLTSYDDDQNENINYTGHPSTAADAKIGEIFHVTKDHFKFVCAHCFAEFPLLVQFTAHVQQHLQKIYSESVDTKLFNDFDLIDVKPLQLDYLAGPSSGEPDSVLPKMKRKSVKCTDCDKYFDQLLHLRRHREAVHEGKMFQCTKCNMKIAWKCNMLRHMRNLHPTDDSYYPLTIFYSKEKCAAAENAKKNDPNLFECCQCNKTFADPASLKEHWNGHEPAIKATQGKKKLKCKKEKNVEYNCDICKARFTSKSSLCDHMKTEHAASEIDNSLSPTDRTSSVEMMAKSQATSSAKNLNQPRYQKTVCEICNLELGNKWSLTWHKRRMHHIGNRAAKKFYECYLCRKQFKQRRELPKHFRQEHMKKLSYREYRFILRDCKQCGEKFNDLHLLSKHYLWHKEQNQGRQHKCEVCEKTFISRYLLQYHMVTHATTRDFKCDICNKTFRCRSSKFKHMRIHTGQGGKQCEECGKILRDNPKLKRHMLTHTGENPFECEYCHKRFRQSYSLTIHKQSHTGVYIHYCKPCERGFGYRRELRKHNLRVHGIEMVENDTK